MNTLLGISQSANQKIFNLFKKFPEIERVIIFGSRAIGTHKEGSDIDLALVGKNISSKTIQNLRLKYYDLNLPYKLDLINYEVIDNLQLKQHIDNYGKFFYSSDKDKG